MYLGSNYKGYLYKTKSMEAMRNSLIISDDISRRQNLSTIVNFLGENCHSVEFSKTIELLKVGAEIDGVFTYSALTASIEKCRSFLINNSKKRKKSNKPILFCSLVCESQQIRHVRQLNEQVKSGTLSLDESSKIYFMRTDQDVLVVVCEQSKSLRDGHTSIKVLNPVKDALKFKIVANMVLHISEVQEIFQKLSMVESRFFDMSLELMDTLPFDENIQKSFRKQCLLVDAYPASPPVIAVNNIAQRAMDWPIPKQPGGHLEFLIEKLVAKKALGDVL
jgi:hypothetical protein